MLNVVYQNRKLSVEKQYVERMSVERKRVDNMSVEKTVCRKNEWRKILC